MNEDLNEADRILHSLAQLVALTGTNTLPHQPDDSQANIDWNADRQWLEGRAFVDDDQSLRLIIDLPTFSLYFLDGNDQPVASFAVQGKTPDEAAAWWQSVMQSWDFDTTKPLSYQLDSAPVPPETPYVRPAGLTEWANWRTIAHQQLTTLNEQSGRTSDIRIWPHHFDTGVYYSISDEAGHEKAAIWAGYAIADAVSAEPYFYLSGYNSRQPVGFSMAPALTSGEWLSRSDWQGAYLPVSGATDANKITDFFAESYAWLSEKIIH